jgi:hypothetical protein
MCSSPNVKISSLVKKATNDAAGAAVAALALASCVAASPAPAAPSWGVSAVAAAPPVDFAFDSLDARPVSADQTRGEPTIITFVTTSSIPAQAEVDFLVAMAKHDADRLHYAVVALESGENRELVELYAHALSVSFPVAMADRGTIEGTGPFGSMTELPVTVVLDRAGRIVWRAAGRVAKSAEIRAVLRAL